MSSSQEALREMITAEAVEWFVAHRSSPLNDVQREKFIEWLRTSPAHVREYFALTGLAEDVSEVVKSFTRAPSPLHSPDRPRNRSAVFAVGAWVMAAMVAVAIVAQWLSYAPDYSTAHAEQRSWRLADGSTVHLNSASELKVRFSAQGRQVELLKGEATFQVAQDPARPFTVRAGDAVVKAVGTEFDVYRRESGTWVSVVEGRVALWPGAASGGAHEPGPMLLSAGQQAQLGAAGPVISKKPESVRNTVAWLQRQVVLDHDPLSMAVTELNRYNTVQIRLADEATAAAEISGIFSAYDVDSFVRFLERQPGMQVVRSGDSVVVSAREVTR